MRSIILFIIILSGYTPLLAKDGFTVKINFTDAKDSMVYLAHYYGKSSEAYRVDSAYLDNQGNVTFRSDKKIVGGIYLILFGSKVGNLDFVLNNGDDIAMVTSRKEGNKNTTCKGSKDNDLYFDYQRYIVGYGKEYQALEGQLKTCKNKSDSDIVIKQLNDKNKVLQEYRSTISSKYPQLLLSKLFNCIKEPQVPSVWPTLPNGRKDSTFPQRYYKQHFWDNFDFTDNRIIYTPVYESKLEYYLSKIVYPVPDSINYEAEKILAKAQASEEMYKYTLWFLTYWTENSKIMGLDESFVYLVENYYLKNKAPWVDSAQIAKYMVRAKEIAPCILNAKIRDITVSDTSNTHKISLYGINSTRTILLFWSPTCSHCQEDLPRFDSLVHMAAFKKYGIKILAVNIDDDVPKWKEFIRKNKLYEGWIHGYNPERNINFKSFYDVYATPTLYLLDKDKVILGKRLDAKNILGYLDFLETKKKEENSNKQKK